MRLILHVLAVIAFAGAAIAIRDAAHWAWLIPAGLALWSASGLPWLAHLDVHFGPAPQPPQA